MGIMGGGIGDCPDRNVSARTKDRCLAGWVGRIRSGRDDYRESNGSSRSCQRDSGAILAAAERLFAERGIASVSNRQVSEEAGQGNNAAVGYHFGTKVDLVRAIVRKHNAHVERLCQQMVAQVGDSTDVRDWVTCLVRPLTEYLDSLGNPTWYARFSAQLMPDPAFREVISGESLVSSSLLTIIAGLERSLGDLPANVRRERFAMARLLIVHTSAQLERTLADGGTGSDWTATGASLIDAITGLLLAPATAG